MNRVKKIQLLIDYQCTLLKKYYFQLLNARSVRNKVDLITQLIIYSNCSISAIRYPTDTWLTIDEYALAYQLTPDGFKVLLANKHTSHRHGGLVGSIILVGT